MPLKGGTKLAIMIDCRREHRHGHPHGGGRPAGRCMASVGRPTESQAPMPSVHTVALNNWGFSTVAYDENFTLKKKRNRKKLAAMWLG
jgi:hypothetical protein